jgi:hypothetical protein
VQEAEQYLKLVKKYAELHELPHIKAPWELEEDRAQLRDEMTSQNIEPEKVQNPEEAQEAE